MLLRNKRIRKTLISVLISIVLAAPAFSYALPVQCYCVLWLRQVEGINVRGDAWTIQPNLELKNASVGDVLLLSYNVGHAAEITGFEGQMALGGYVVPRYITIVESNYEHCKVTTRTLAWTDPAIRGVYHPLSPIV